MQHMQQMQQKFSFLLLLIILLPLSACSLFSDDDEQEPMALEKIDKTIKIKKHWSRRLGFQGEDEMHMRLLPMLDGDSIYAVNAKGRVYALNKESGKKRWVMDTNEWISSAVGAGENVVAIATVNGELLVLDQANGQELWRVQLSSEMLAAAQIRAGVLVAQTIDGVVLGFDKGSGNILWRYQAVLPSLTLRGSATPVVSGGVCYLGFANGKVVALDLHTGLLRWEQQVSIAEGRTELERLIDFDGQPLVVGSDLYIAGYQGNAAAMDKTRGQGLWIEEASTTGALASGNGNLYIAESNGRVLALKMATGRRLWQNESLLLRELSSPAVVGDYIVVADFEGYVHFMEQDSGAFSGRYKVGGNGVRNALLSDGDTLYVLNNKGKLFSLYSKAK